VVAIDQLGNTILALLRHPEQIGRVRENPGLVRPAAEEGLRYDVIAQLVARIARENLALRGETIRRGDSLRLATRATTRDPGMFAEPGRFDAGRTGNPHQAFGTGPH